MSIALLLLRLQPRRPAISAQNRQVIRHARDLILYPKMPATSVDQGAAEPSGRHFLLRLLASLAEQPQRIDGPDGEADAGPSLETPVQKGATLAAEGARATLGAVILLERVERGSPRQTGVRHPLPDEKEPRGGLSALRALAGRALREDVSQVNGMSGYNWSGHVRSP
jgi:hypothetical protein